MKTSKLLFTIVLSLLISNYCKAQGCSDAGICTINSFKPNAIDSTTSMKNILSIGAFWGRADHSIAAYGNFIEFSRHLNDKVELSAKLTTLTQQGNGLNTFGLSDFFLNANYKIASRSKLTIGAKIPFSKADKQAEGHPLPMDYQSSLGTFDCYVGFGTGIGAFQFLIAAQQPITQNNNQFLASNSTNPNLYAFQSTNKFHRSGDVLIRVSYSTNISSKFKLTPSILPIYHLSNDSYTDELNIKRIIIGSQGLTFNSNLYLAYVMNPKTTLQISLGMPIVVRDIRPEGLTRSIIANLQYSIKF